MKNPLLQMFVGLIVGLIVPILFGWLFLHKFYDYYFSFTEIFGLLKSTAFIMRLLFVSVLPNMLAMFLLNHFEQWNYFRGVFVSIMLYITVAVLTYFYA